MAKSLWRRISFVKILLVVLNIISTFLLAFTGLSENRLLIHITGRYDFFRRRLQDGSINFAIVEPEQFTLEELATPKELSSYIILTTPWRDPHSVGDYRSVCTNINTISAPVMISYFDDFWGKTARRVQIYLNRISTPKCEVLNVKPAWRDKCVADHKGNSTRCHQYVLDNFDTLRKNRRIRMGVVKDLGAIGAPFLRCLGRPLTGFSFQADLLANNAYWAGRDYHVSVQTSDCKGVPLVRSDDLMYTHFQSVNVDEACEMTYLVPPAGWFAEVVAWLQSIVTLVMIVRGVVLALFHSRVVRYLPEAVRFAENRKLLRAAMPFMPLITFFSEDERAVISFKGSLLLASDVWMSHRLYMCLSILDALVSIRLTYTTLQVATALLVFKVTIGSLIFLFAAITKMTWIMCLVQTLLRVLFRFVARFQRALRLIRSTTREQIEWNVDGVSMFLSYRLCHLMLCIIVFVCSKSRIASFWGSEVACDLISLVSVLVAVSQVIGAALQFTRYRYVANNSLMRFLQQRGYTKLSLGSLLQALYLSGPSGYVHLGGDYIFYDGGFAKEPTKFKYPMTKAMSMGLYHTANGSVMTTKATVGTTADPHAASRDTTASLQVAKVSIFDRRLRVVSEGYRGKLLLIDLADPGQIVTDKQTGQRDFEATDALTTMTILDIKWLLGNCEKQLRIQ